MSTVRFEIVRKKEYDMYVDSYKECDITPYDELLLPKRGSANSAGYDFYSPANYLIRPGDCVTIPTFVKVHVWDRQFLAIYPRSSLGFKYHMVLANTVGIIDADYYENETNDGHIMIKVFNMGDETFEIKQGDRFAQGIIQAFFITHDDMTVEERNGGIGSTGK